MMLAMSLIKAFQIEKYFTKSKPYSDSLSSSRCGKAGNLKMSSLFDDDVGPLLLGDICLPNKLLTAVFLLNKIASSLLILSDSELYLAL